VAVRSANKQEEFAPDALTGTWQLVNSGNDALPNAKLMLWSKTPFEWTREQVSPVYITWLTEHLPEVNCPQSSPEVEHRSPG